MLHGDIDEANTGVARTVKTAIDWLERRGGEKALRTLARPLQPARTLGSASPIATSTSRLSLMNSRPARKGTSSMRSPGMTMKRSPSKTSRRLIDVPAGAVGDVLSEAELFRLRRTYAGTVSLGRPMAG